MNEKGSYKQRLGWLLFLHIALLIYSMSSFFNKNASAQTFLSPTFIFFICGTIFVLGTYAIMWQQVIKHMPLTTAYANKGIAIIWGMVIGKLAFAESITPRKLVAAAIIIVGVVLYVRADREQVAAEEAATEHTAADSTAADGIVADSTAADGIAADSIAADSMADEHAAVENTAEKTEGGEER